MKAKLVIVSPEVQPNEFELKLPTKIGRGHEAKLKLVHPLISRLHCEFFEDGDRIMIRDLDSLNGTFVNQERITEDTALTSGATVMIGSVMARVQIGDDADRLPPAAAMTKTVGATETVRKAPEQSADAAATTPEEGTFWEEQTATADHKSSEGLLDLDFDDDEPAHATPDAAATTSAAPKSPSGLPAPANEPATTPAPNLAPQHPAAKPTVKPAASVDDEFNLIPPDELADAKQGGSQEDADLDDFFKSIM